MASDSFLSATMGDDCLKEQMLDCCQGGALGDRFGCASQQVESLVLSEVLREVLDWVGLAGFAWRVE